MGKIIAPAAGFPKAVPPADAGVADPAARLSVVGYCTAAELPAAMEIVRAIYPQARAVEARAGEPGTCPKLPTEARVKVVHTVKPYAGEPDTRLTGILFLRQPMPDETRERRDPRDPEAGIWRVHAMLFGGDDPEGSATREYRSLRDAKVAPSRCTVKLVPSGVSLDLDARCDRERDPRASPCAEIEYTHLSESTRFSARGSVVQASTTVRKKVKPPPCPFND